MLLVITPKTRREKNNNTKAKKNKEKKPKEEVIKIKKISEKFKEKKNCQLCFKQEPGLAQGSIGPKTTTLSVTYSNILNTNNRFIPILVFFII